MRRESALITVAVIIAALCLSILASVLFAYRRLLKKRW
jgi:hypothetical protein